MITCQGGTGPNVQRTSPASESRVKPPSAAKLGSGAWSRRAQPITLLENHMRLRAVAVVLDLVFPKLAAGTRSESVGLQGGMYAVANRSAWRLSRRGTTTPLRSLVASATSGARVIARGGRGGFGMPHQSMPAGKVDSPPQ